MKKKTRRRKSKTVQWWETIDWTSLSPEEEEKKIIEMLVAHVPLNEIAYVSKRGLKRIIEIKEKHQQSLKPRTKSLASQAFKLFKEEGKTVLDIAIELGIEASEAEGYLAQYWRLRNLDNLYALYNDLGGSKLGEFIATYNHLSSRGITVDQAIEIRNLSLKVNELKSHFNSLTKEVAQLSTDIPQMREQRDGLSRQLGNLDSELNNRKAINEQLRHEYDDLSSVLNTIKQGDITFLRIEQIAKKEGESIMASRDEQIFTCLFVIITILKNDPKLVALLISPGPGLYHPDLRKKVLTLINNAWSEISNSVDKKAMELLFDGVRQLVKDSQRLGS